MICIPAWPCDLCLPLQRQKLSVVSLWFMGEMKQHFGVGRIGL